MTKTCPKCKVVYPATQEYFHQDISRLGGLANQCKKCRKIAGRIQYLRDPVKHLERKTAWKRANPEKAYLGTRRLDLKCKYGITLEQYDQMFDAQGGVCAICGEPEAVANKHGVCRLSVDHDHETNKVRMLLCNKCNHGLGLFDENLEKLLKAMHYLIVHRKGK